MSIFHYPPVGTASFGREIVSAVAGDGTPVAVAQTECNGIAEVTLLRPDESRSVQRERLSGERRPTPHQPRVTRGVSGFCHVVWNAWSDSEWQVRFRSFEGPSSPAPIEVVHQSTGVIFPPAVADDGATVRVVWAEEVGGQFGIYCASRPIQGDEWTVPTRLSADDADCLRPCIVPTRDGWLIAWDRLADGRHAVQYTTINGTRAPTILTLSHDRERWLKPRCVVDRDGNAYLAWLAVSVVCHEGLGVYDHQTAGMCARIEGEAARMLEDRDSPWEPRFAADLREGLLATEVHIGHHGLRRNLQPCIWRGQLWLCWELRQEAHKTQARGLLVGRAWQDEAWSPTVLLHEGKLSYSVPSNIEQEGVPVFFVDMEHEDGASVQFDTVDLSTRTASEQRDAGEWAQWRPAAYIATPPRGEPLDVDGEKLHLFWADTHCHSAFSSDAEGELDELVAFGRDVAGLDIMAIVDNDYYPFKALTDSEWRMLQHTAQHYTQPGRFVLLPAYEYTYWRRSQDGKAAEFNHRYVLYPLTGGPLVRRIDRGGADDAALMRTLRHTDAQLVAHHTAWDLLDENLDRNVEVCSSWRICIEECDFIQRQLLAGKRFGFVGSSDTHRMVPGLGGALTGVFATELTPEAVLHAYRRRRLIATSGSRMLIDFRVGDYFVGEEGVLAGAPRVTGRVQAFREIEQVDVIRDGRVMRRLTPDADTIELDFADEGASIGSHFYFLRVKLVGDPSFNIGTVNMQEYRAFRTAGRYAGNWARGDGCFGWSSPIWIEVSK